MPQAGIKIHFFLLFVSILIIVYVYCLQPILADNSNSTQIPIVKHEIKLDGNFVKDEWKDALNITFPEARNEGQNVSLYMKYNPDNRVLDGFFTIPGRSAPLFQSTSYEGIHLRFDVEGGANKYLSLDDHDITFYRDGTVRYLIGDKGKEWIINSTSATSETQLPLQSQFSKIDYKIIPTSDSWKGQFKLYFNTTPTLYGFSILEETPIISRTGHQNSSSAKYPTSSNLMNPFTWRKISFPNISSSIVSPPAKISNTGIGHTNISNNRSELPLPIGPLPKIDPTVLAAIITTIGSIIGVIITVRAKSNRDGR
jgi:hypothetical protein